MRKTLLIVILLGLSVFGISTANGDDSNIFRLREGFIYNFLKFVSWPEPLPFNKTNICIVGDHAFAENFIAWENNIKEEETKAHIRELTDYGSITSCRILFIGKDDEGNLNTILSHTRHKAVLTISEIRGFADQDGIIEIATASMQVGLFSKDKVNLRINLRAAHDGGLNIDARLLQIAAEIIK